MRDPTAMRLLLSTTAVLALSCSVLTAAPQDSIYRKGANRPIKGDVLAENCLVVKYRPAGIDIDQELDARQVTKIVHDDAPESFRKGVDYLEAGDAANAISSFKLAASERGGKWLEAYCHYYLGLAYHLAGATDRAAYSQAATSLDNLLRDEPESRFLADALRVWGDSLSRNRDPDGAARIFDRLENEAREKKLGIIWEARAKVLKAEAYARNAQPDKAKTAFQNAGSFARSNAPNIEEADVKAELLEIAGRAQLSEGVTLLENAQYSEARRAFEKIAADDKAAPAVAAEALCGLGEVLLKEGKLRDAYDQFARVRIEHFLQTEATARATYFLGKVCLELKDDEPNGKRKAREYFTEVVERYATTSWAELAKAELR